MDQLREGADVLGALVGDACDAVVVDDDVGRGGRFFERGVEGEGLRDEGVHDGSVGDAAGDG